MPRGSLLHNSVTQKQRNAGVWMAWGTSFRDQKELEPVQDRTLVAVSYVLV